jgi:perosamine synthetase
LSEKAILREEDDNIVLFRPFIPKNAIDAVSEVLESRWIGQGPLVQKFEESFNVMFGGIETVSLSTNSATSALHLAFILAGIKPGDKVLAPVMTCTATNIPLMYVGAHIEWIDINENNLNISLEKIEKQIDKDVKAIVIVHYGGYPVDLEHLSKLAKKYSIPIIQDAAHALGAKINGQNISEFGDYTIFSFQAIKHITTGDGGMLVIKNKSQENLLKKLRWFGIDREKKQAGIWENDIVDVGYKYQMNDIAASLGIAALGEFSQELEKRNNNYKLYIEHLSKIKEVRVLNPLDDITFHNAYWLFIIEVERREELIDFLREKKIESGLVHYRNDRYKIFEKFKSENPNMDKIEHKYLCLPFHSRIGVKEIKKVSEAVGEFFGITA